MRIEDLEVITIMKQDERKTISMVYDPLARHYYVKKEIKAPFNRKVHQILMDHPHPGFANVCALEAVDDVLIVIEELINGHDLEYVLQDQVIATEEAYKYILELLDVLEHLHHLEPPIIHRDIKPGNVMIEKGHAILIDFDIAREYHLSQSKDTVIMGSVGYAAPEQFGFSQSDPRTDIYAMGILINEMLTGKHPKEELVSGKMADVVVTCMHMDPKQRYANISSLRIAFTDAMVIQHRILKEVPPQTQSVPQSNTINKRNKLDLWGLLFYAVVSIICIMMYNDLLSQRNPINCLMSSGLFAFFCILGRFIYKNKWGIRDVTRLNKSQYRIVRFLHALLIYFVYAFIATIAFAILYGILLSMQQAYQLTQKVR